MSVQYIVKLLFMSNPVLIYSGYIDVDDIFLPFILDLISIVQLTLIFIIYASYREKCNPICPFVIRHCIIGNQAYFTFTDFVLKTKT